MDGCLSFQYTIGFYIAGTLWNYLIPQECKVLGRKKPSPILLDSVMDTCELNLTKDRL
jgi:hypothetical protein